MTHNRPSEILLSPDALQQRAGIMMDETVDQHAVRGVVTLFECGHVRPTLRFSGRPCTHGFPRGHCLASMGSNLCCGAVGLGWDEEVSHGGEDRHEMLQ